VWGRAIVHFVVEGAIKLVTVDDSAAVLSLVWIAAAALLPYLVFVAPRHKAAGRLLNRHS
jgi:hypothetical protein